MGIDGFTRHSQRLDQGWGHQLKAKAILIGRIKTVSGVAEELSDGDSSLEVCRGILGVHGELMSGTEPYA